MSHTFSYNCSFNHDFGRITGIAASTEGNILLCDYDNKHLILVDSLGIFLKKLSIDSEPYDLAITSENIGYITQPNARSVLQIDPDRMVLLCKSTCNDLSTTVFCVSALPKTTMGLFSEQEEAMPCIIGVKIHSSMYAIPVVNNNGEENINLTDISPRQRLLIGSHAIKFYAVNDYTSISCKGGQNCITYSQQSQNPRNCSIATMDKPTDICKDEYGYFYVSGQGSNNIHRLKQDLKVLDIPLHSQHGINKPVALCFSQNYTKLYIVNEWGKSVLVFDVY